MIFYRRRVTIKMKTQKFTKKFHALVITFVMLITQLVAVLPASAANSILPVAQYVTQNGSATGGAGGNSATYNGTVKLKIPMSKVLEPNETEMANAAANGLYPHGREGKDKIAYIEYNVTFPEDVNIGNISVANSVSYINGNKIIKTVNGRTVNFKLYLNDVNWAGIYNAYLADKMNPNAHTVDISIPYSVTANDKAAAARMEGENIVGKGDFSFYPSGFGASWGFGLETYNTDVANVRFAQNLTQFFPQDLTTTGDLEGDILVGNETEHNAVYEAQKNDTIDFTGSLNVKPIKDELSRLEKQFSDAVNAGIKVENIDTTFNTSIELPAGMKFKDANPTVKLVGANDKFEITDSSLNGNKVDVTIKLKNANDIRNYNDLKKAISAVDDNLKVVVKGAQFTAEATPGTNYTVVGKVGGNFRAKATNTVSNKVINFNYVWNGKQSAAGADAINTTDLSKISFTLKYKNPKPIDVTDERDLEGDILIGNETEHNQIYETGRTDRHEITGLLKVKPIKDQMTQIEKHYNNPAANQISLDAVDTTFTASLELPNEMTFGTDTPNATLEGANNVFKITKVTRTGNKVVVTIKLIKTYTNYKDFARDIRSVSDDLKVKVGGVKFTNDAVVNTNYTMKGEVGGLFKAKATHITTGNVVNFNLKWNGKQSADGADAIAPTDLSKITFTMKYKAPDPINSNYVGNLEGDILIGNETEHTQVYASHKNAKHEFTGLLVVKPIKDTLTQLENKFGVNAVSQIKLNDVDTTFTATLELPAGMKWSPNSSNATLEGSNGIFKITDSVIVGNKITVRMKLIKTYDNYRDLANDIRSVEDNLKVKVPGVVFTDDSNANTNYTVKGKVGGVFSAKATHVTTGQVVNFNYKWNGKQNVDGADAIAPTDLSKITFTLKYAPETTPVTPIKPKKPDKLNKVVKTGDATDILFYMLIICGAVAGIAGATGFRKREER